MPQKLPEKGLPCIPRPVVKCHNSVMNNKTVVVHLFSQHGDLLIDPWMVNSGERRNSCIPTSAFSELQLNEKPAGLLPAFCVVCILMLKPSPTPVADGPCSLWLPSWLQMPSEYAITLLTMAKPLKKFAPRSGFWAPSSIILCSS